MPLHKGQRETEKNKFMNIGRPSLFGSYLKKHNGILND